MKKKGWGGGVSEERLCTLGVAVCLQGREWPRRWGAGRRERGEQEEEEGEEGLKQKGKEPAVPLSRTCC